ncbi:type II toxin-antitoxin system RelE/ParE family toxin [Novosphingobium sp. Gsoil 351]|uniref:type II toxin-antitoxin system RelE/ParE family toxin n=1 Tax=Novosphingobium sp. Gsoil 351 TaxID=2675225 RepID=UPI0012B4CA43|nr:type II toxin-antitoxin system RelE/ParE family toxin [Novosphingobium sp. Gsoil 351]QGN55081.1 plasmid maintenance system killer [Novosphingobium sp. Gsoil 351]
MQQPVEIASLRHKGLERLYKRNHPSKLDARTIDKLRKQFFFLDAMDHSDELRTLALGKAHRLSDSRWSLHVIANYRMTFDVNDVTRTITILDLEDYH